MDRRQRGSGSLLAFLLPAAFLAAGAGLSLAVFSQTLRVADARLRGDFRFDAYQRTEIVVRALRESRRDFEALIRFLASSAPPSPADFEDFAAPWIEDGTLQGLASFGPATLRRLGEGSSPALDRDAGFCPTSFADYLARNREAAAAIGEAVARSLRAGPRPGGSGAAEGVAVTPFREAGAAAYSAAVAAALPDGRFAVAILSLELAVEGAIGRSAPVGLPTAVYDLSGGDSLLLEYHAPRLDAGMGRPLLAPEAGAPMWSQEELRFFDRRWAIRVEASPMYRELRRNPSPLLALVLCLACSALGAAYVSSLFRRRLVAETVADERGRELSRYFALGRDFFCSGDATGRLRRVNAEWGRSLGFGAEALVGRPFLSLVAREDRAATKAVMRALLRGERVDDFTHRVVAADGSRRWFEWRAVADPESGLAYAAGRDVTDRALADQRLRSSLREKETLIREIHHRVKNNMQVISSLVSLEARFAGGPAGEGGRRIQALIRAMALVHEAVYCSEELDAVRMAPYLRDLAAAEASVTTRGSVRIEVEVGESVLDIERATLCGLAADELMAVALARGDGDGPALRLTGGSQPDGGFRLAFETGPSEPGWDLSAGGGLGERLVAALVAQMEGEFRAAGRLAEIRLPAR